MQLQTWGGSVKELVATGSELANIDSSIVVRISTSLNQQTCTALLYLVQKHVSMDYCRSSEESCVISLESLRKTKLVLLNNTVRSWKSISRSTCRIFSYRKIKYCSIFCRTSCRFMNNLS